MNPLPSCVAMIALSGALCAQVVEIPAMTVNAVVVDMDSLNGGAAGATTLAAIRNAGNGGSAVAQIAAITLSQGTAANGFYNVNTAGGNGLARNITTNALTVVAPMQNFGAFDATLDFQVRSREFGFSVGDWTGGMVLEFRNVIDNSLVATHSSSPFTTVAAKFFRAPADFDRVVIRADTDEGNWVLTQLSVASTPPWTPFGTGCPGNFGIPVLDSITAPAINNTFSLSITNMPPGGGALFVSLGFSTTVDPVFGALPFDLAGLGAPGCAVVSAVSELTFLLHTNGTAQYDLGIPNNPVFVGALITNQAFVGDAGANAFGLIASNGGVGHIQP